MPADERGRAWTVIEDGLRVRSFISGSDPVEAAFVVMDSERAAFHARGAEQRLAEAETQAERTLDRALRAEARAERLEEALKGVARSALAALDGSKP